MYADDLASPLVVAIDTDSDQTFGASETLRGIDVFAPGDLHITDVKGTEITVTFPTVANGGSYPCRWVVQIKTIHDTGTTIADSNLVGLR